MEPQKQTPYKTMTQTQTQKILAYLLNGGNLTAIDALKKFKCFRLASRINDIRCMNKYKIVREWVNKGSKRVMRYSIPV